MNSFAISSAQIGEGMQSAGSALASAGNSLEQSIALLTAATTQTQNVDKSATALRTISARIRGTKDELDDLGESMDENINTTAKYRQALIATAGVDIMDSTGKNFRTTYDILKDIAGKWESLNGLQQASVTNMVAGEYGRPSAQKCA